MSQMPPQPFPGSGPPMGDPRTMPPMIAGYYQNQPQPGPPPAAPAYQPPVQQAGPPPAPSFTPPPVSQPVAPPAMPATDPHGNQIVAPPWADNQCRACEGWGFDSTGIPCKICDASSPARAARSSAEFDIEYAGPAREFVYWRHKQHTNWTGVSWHGPNAARKSQSSVSDQPLVAGGIPVVGSIGPNGAVSGQIPAASGEVPPAPGGKDKGKGRKGKNKEAAADPAPNQEAIAATGGALPGAMPSVPEVPKGEPGRPGKTFTLAQNIAILRGHETRGDRKVTYLSHILRDCYDQIVKHLGAPSIHDVPADHRRFLLLKMLDQMAPNLTGIVIADGLTADDSDLRAAFLQIEPVASMVIQPSASAFNFLCDPPQS